MRWIQTLFCTLQALELSMQTVHRDSSMLMVSAEAWILGSK